MVYVWWGVWVWAVCAAAGSWGVGRVVYRCQSQNLLFHRIFFLEFGDFPRKFGRESRDSGPEACCNVDSNHTSVFGCPEFM